MLPRFRYDTMRCYSPKDLREHFDLLKQERAEWLAEGNTTAVQQLDADINQVIEIASELGYTQLAGAIEQFLHTERAP